MKEVRKAEKHSELEWWKCCSHKDSLCVCACACMCVLKSWKVIVKSAVVAKRASAVHECVVFCLAACSLQNAVAAPKGHFSSNEAI